MRIGILTMHRVMNFGSILQAYALQRALDNQGFENEIIDYSFPPKENLLVRFNFIIRKFFYDIRTLEFFNKSKKEYFKEFTNKYLHLSSHEYNRKTIVMTKYNYDLFITGSDQVWNPRWTKDDTNFLLGFVDEETIKVSFASSFACEIIPKSLEKEYSRLLSRYKSISIREQKGAEIVYNLIAKKAEIVCDPTLLLDCQDYHNLSVDSKVCIEGKYILVYILSYMYNPFPEINNIITYVKSTLNLPIVYIGGKYTRIDKSCKYYENIGPTEFLWLVEHAEFVITTSFHGVAFSTIFNRPLLAVTKGDKSGDDRIPSLLNQVENKNAFVAYNDKIKYTKQELYSFTCKESARDNFRLDSLKWLQNQLL